MQSESCSLCFAPCDKLSEPIHEDAVESLAQLLPHLAKTPNISQMTCTNCSTSLKRYLEFKCNFLQTQACVQSFDTKQSGGLLDLRQVYLQNKGDGNEVSSREEFEVCRFCLKQATGTYTPLVEDHKELSLVTIMVEKCFSGLELGTISGGVICVSCHEVLEASYNFIISLDVDERIKVEDTTEEMEFDEGQDLKAVQLDAFRSGNDCVDLKAIKEEDDRSTANEDDFDRKIDVCKKELEENYKVEIGAIQTDGSRNQDVYVDSVKDADIKEEVVSKEDNLGAIRGVKLEQTASRSGSGRKSAVRSKTTYKCESCSYETKRKQDLTSHQLIHKNLSEVPIYKCEHCEYTSKYKSNIPTHMLVHEKPSQITMFGCALCPYKCKQRFSLKKHMLIHKNTSEVTMYKCKSCTFETSRKFHLTYHELIHQNPSEVHMYKCEVCAFETKYKRNFGRHLLVHKSPSELTMYSCTVCPYQAKVQGNLAKHMLIHNDPSKVTTYKCESCPYQTKRKQSLKHHELSHKNPSKLAMFKCKTCSYLTKCRRNYNRHMLIHKKPSEITMYKCESCSYETRLKQNLKYHELSHKDPSDLTMFKCDQCPYEAKLKSNLNNHMLLHKDPSQVLVFQCELCPYQTKLKKNFDRHMLVHKGPGEVYMFKCASCDYETKNKGNLKKHMFVHQRTDKVKV